MKISFTGIQNLNTYSGWQNVSLKLPYYTQKDTIYPGTKSEININCILNDDIQDGNEDNMDLKNFYDAIRKSNTLCTNSANPYEVNIKAECYELNDKDVLSGSIINYSINDYPIKLNEPSDRKFLHLFTFMAKLTSKIAKQQTYLPEERRDAEVFNQWCHASAMHFIDNIM